MGSINACVMSKSAASSLFLENKGSSGMGAEIISAKTSAPDFAKNPSQQQCSPSYATSGHLVYARRKPEVDSSKSTGGGSQRVGTDCDPGIKSSNHYEAFKCGEDLKEPENKSTDTVQNPCVDILAEKPSLSSSSSVPQTNSISPSDFSPHITATEAGPLLVDKNIVNFKQLHECNYNLQDALREFDRANQDEYIQILRTLSSAELSRLAVDLEKRAIQVTFVEAKELQRACAFNILESSPENV